MSSLLTGSNAAFIDSLYQQWLADPASVDVEWRAFFEGYDAPDAGESLANGGPSWAPRSIFHGSGGSGGAIDEHELKRQVATTVLINAYRVRGHLQATIDPLERRVITGHPELTLEHYGLSDADLDAEVLTRPLYGVPARMKLREVVEHCRACYCTSIGAEFMNIDDVVQKQWIAEKLETLPGKDILGWDEELRFLRKMSDAENFERVLHNRFPGTKRFSLEGGETLVPLMDMLIHQAGENGVKEMVIGMPHRGRLSVMANVFEKSVRVMVSEFHDTGGGDDGSGDVKYHLGYSSDIETAAGKSVHLNLSFNPSHLEAVNPVVIGRIRAKQDRNGDTKRWRAVPVLLHGDAAFAGQGLVAEVLQMSELDGYTAGGTIHIIVNNQIGFTATPDESRSTPYSSGVARMLAVPIFHVNGEDPWAVAAVTRMAMEWRQKFHRDVIIDMYCYRKFGHNEGDEPAFTQPLMYANIRARPTPRTVFAKHLISRGRVTEEQAKQIYDQSYKDFEDALSEREEATASASERTDEVKKLVDDFDVFSKDVSAAVSGAKGDDIDVDSPLKGLWSRYRGGIDDEVDTTMDIEVLRALMVKANTLPEGFSPHRKIKRLLKQRLEMIAGDRPMDWAVAEQAAYATLLVDGHGVRLSGQDSGRGTFTHRHAIVTGQDDAVDYFPLDNLADIQAQFTVINSVLSEAGVLGFEYGYTLDAPDELVIWEAQFGDFANGAQVLIDQFITTSEQKWNRLTGIVMMLPHGYEGQGPEHSSSRIERYLQACAQDNIQVANITMPSNIYHLLRRQMMRRTRKPLVIMTPKSGLRHALATSKMEDLATGHFQKVIGEIDDIAPDKVRRVVLCSGKIYFELLEKRRAEKIDDVVLIRIEMLHPFPIRDIRVELDRYPESAELVWCQEEPKNMGAWPRYLHWFYEQMPNRMPRYVGRKDSASPATGSKSKHVAEQTGLVVRALRRERGVLANASSKKPTNL